MWHYDGCGITRVCEAAKSNIVGATEAASLALGLTRDSQDYIDDVA